MFNFENSYLSLNEMFYSKVSPAKFKEPKLILYNENLAQSLDINIENNRAEILSGQEILKSGSYIAQSYAGHQFGHFTMLGDGRALMLGEHVHNGKHFDVQMKGSGRTPYSRMGDGKSALGPMLREYIISEAMHYLRIPTNRALSVVTTGEEVMRHTQEAGAVLTRIGSSFIRVGTFEFAIRSREDSKNVKELANYSIDRHYPELKNNPNKYSLFLKAVVHTQAKLIAKWMSIGFIHGVMNTDNMSICGETFDYGPCAFMDQYHPNTVFSSIDHNGRYAYSNQPQIAQWNLTRFAETLVDLIAEENEAEGVKKTREHAIETCEEILNTFSHVYNEAWLDIMGQKLGLNIEGDSDTQLLREFLTILTEEEADFTSTFRQLSEGNGEGLLNHKGYDSWYEQWFNRVTKTKKIEDVLEQMKCVNPSVIPRNHNVEAAIESALEGNFDVFYELLEVLKDPFASTHDKKWTNAPNETIVYQTYCGT